MKRIAMLFPGSLGSTDTPLHVPEHVDLLDRLSRQFEIIAYTLVKPDGDASTFKCGKAKVKYVNARYDDKAWKKVLAFYGAIAIDHRSEPFDAFHGLKAIACGLSAVMLGSRFRKKSIVSLQGGEAANLPEIDYGDLRKQPLKGLTLRTCRGADVLTALTQFQSDALQLHGIRNSDLHVIPYGASELFFDQSQNKTLSPPYNILHIGDLNRVKDQPTLLRAFKIISGQVDARLRVIGADYMQGELQGLAKELQIIDRVEFLGYIKHQELGKHLQWAHMLLHSSLYEGQGLVIAEAAASGVPVCGTRVGLIADLEGSCCSAVPIGDFRGLAEATLALLSDSAKYQSMKKRAAEWASEHTAQWTAEQFAGLYNESHSI